MEYSESTCSDGSGILISINTLTCSFASDQLYILVFDEILESTDSI